MRKDPKPVKKPSKLKIWLIVFSIFFVLVLSALYFFFFSQKVLEDYNYFCYKTTFEGHYVHLDFQKFKRGDSYVLIISNKEDSKIEGYNMEVLAIKGGTTNSENWVIYPLSAKTEGVWNGKSLAGKVESAFRAVYKDSFLIGRLVIPERTQRLKE